MASVEKQTAYRLDLDFAERARHGAWGQVICWMVVFFTTDLFTAHTAVMWSAAATSVILMALRLVVIARIRQANASSLPAWRRRLYGVILLSSAIWGAIAAFCCAADGYHHQSTLLFLLYHSAVAGAGVHLFENDKRLIYINLAILFTPPMLAHAVKPDSSLLGPLFAFALYATYLANLGAKICRQYQGRLEDNRQLAFLANHDALTGLPNRLSIRQALETGMTQATADAGSLALLYIDLDGFKQVNDTLSHRVGDLLLCEVAARLKACAGHSAISFRLGGDEFAVLLSQSATLEAGLKMAERVLRAVQEPVVIEGHTLLAGASIGLSLFPEDADTADDFVRTADLAMYAAKRAGKNRILLASALQIIPPLSGPASTLSLADLAASVNLVLESTALVCPVPD